MTEVRVNRIAEPKVRIKVKPRVPPLEIELQNTGTEIQWRLGTTGDWQNLVDVEDIDASITVGTVTTLPADQSAYVTNVGTPSDAILDFGVPTGGVNSVNGETGVVVIDAGDIGFTPTGDIAATTVAGALAELDSEKLSASQADALFLTPAEGNAAYQPLDSDLSAIAALTTTAFGRAVLGVANAGALATYAGVGTGDSPQFTAVNLGNADTTLTRSAAGRLAVEGVNVALESGQLQFPATQNPSSDPNNLDDYEENTWTPGLTFGGGSTGMTFSVRSGSYTKIGNRVFFEGRITLTAKGSSTGVAKITGLPFTAGNYGACTISYYANLASISGVALAYVDTGAATIQMQNGNAATSAALTDANFTNTSDVLFFGNYRV